MEEAFLHYIWKSKNINFNDLISTRGERIIISQFGHHNQNAGPDFLDASIKIGTTIWYGHIEIHVFASDWTKHKHSSDPNYDNVILHVVYEADRAIRYSNGNFIPTLEIKKYINKKIQKRYHLFSRKGEKIACSGSIQKIDASIKAVWLESLLIERMEAKSSLLEQKLRKYKGNWQLTGYEFLLTHFGMKVNNDPFLYLAERLPYKLLLKHKNSLHDIEALLFGQAGFLTEPENEAYHQLLRTKYLFFKKKYTLHPLPKSSWKFLRLRPANFPTIRLAQLAVLVFQTEFLFSKMLEVTDFNSIKNMLEVKLAGYWLTHYSFGVPSKKKNKKLGAQAILTITLNVIIPLLFAFGRFNGESKYINKALSLLANLPAENNKITRLWASFEWQPKNAGDSQAMIQLKKQYCSKFKCFECQIGHNILKG